jgi:rare lipoprotein A
MIDFSFKEAGTVKAHGMAIIHGKRTASGEIFDENLLTAAHRHYRLVHTKLTNAENGNSVVIRVNDRGPMQEAWI